MNAKHISLMFVGLAALLAAGCCHLNRLSGRPVTLKSVALELSDEPQLSILFTRKMNRQAKNYIGALTRSSRAVLDYQELIQELGGARLANHLRDRIPKVLGRRFGWRPSDSPDAVLAIDWQELVWTAEDSQVPAALTWRMRIELRTEAEPQTVLWRDCLEWTQELGAVSMQQILQMGPDPREELLAEVASGLAGQLARMLVADGLRGAHSK